MLKAHVEKCTYTRFQWLVDCGIDWYNHLPEGHDNFIQHHQTFCKTFLFTYISYILYTGGVLVIYCSTTCKCNVPGLIQTGYLCCRPLSPSTFHTYTLQYISFFRSTTAAEHLPAENVSLIILIRTSSLLFCIKKTIQNQALWSPKQLHCSTVELNSFLICDRMLLP